MRPVVVVRTSEVEGTRDLARTLANLVSAGDLIVLAGEMGAGKTAFAQGFADVFKSNEALASVSPCVCGQNKGFVEPVSPAPSCRCQSSRDLPNMPKGPDGIVGRARIASISRRHALDWKEPS